MSFDDENLEDLDDLEDLQTSTNNLRDVDGIEDENDELLNLALKTSLEENQQSLINSSNEDELLRKAIEASLLENQKQNDDLFNSVLYESLDTVEDDDKILEKVIEESHLSNISIRLNTEIINSGMASNIATIMSMNTSDTVDTYSESDFVNPSYNEYASAHENEYHYTTNGPDEYDEEEYMKMIIQQIKESEELENKIKINKKTKSIIEEQDFEYEEALRQDIEKDKLEKDKLEKQSNTITSKKIEEPEIPKTKEEMRKLRLAFFDRK
jgi:hypothetical protein